jgi:hypothetical protein
MGRTVREVSVVPHTCNVIWDRKNTGGALVSPGVYMVNVKGREGEKTLSLYLK